MTLPWRRGPLVHTFKPRGAVKAAFECRDAEVLLSGPAGTGKSRGALEKLHLSMLLNPNARGLIVRKTLASLGSTALVTWREHVAREALDTGLINYYGGSSEEPPQYRYPNGSKIMIGGMDKSTKIMSSEYDMIYGQEITEFDLADWEALLSRLRNWKISYQQILGDCNPDKPTHWAKLRADAGKITMLESRHEDNPRLFDDDGRITPGGVAYMAILDSLTGVRYHRLRKGLWVAAEGVIYEDWNPAVHVVDRFDIPYEWPRVWVVDFGFVNPFVCQMWAIDPDGREFMYREIYRTQRTVDIHARDILDIVSEPDPDYRHPVGRDGREVERFAHHGRVWTEPRPTKIICDHDAAERALLEREIGLSTVAAHKAVGTGLQVTQADMKARRFFFLRDSVVHRDQALMDAARPASTIEEIPGYVWDTRSGKAPGEDPLKDNDHGCDCLRYRRADLGLASRPNVGRMGGNSARSRRGRLGS